MPTSARSPLLAKSLPIAQSVVIDTKHLVVSRHLRLIASLVYATAVFTLFMWELPKWAATKPILLIALGIPLAFRLVPRNYLYGMRSPRTLWTTEEIWYRQNVITGVVMVAIGVVWLAVLAGR